MTDSVDSKQPKPAPSSWGDDHTTPQLPKTPTLTLPPHRRILSSKAHQQDHRGLRMHTRHLAPHRLTLTAKTTRSVNNPSSRRPTSRSTSFSSAVVKSWAAWDSKRTFLRAPNENSTPSATPWELVETLFAWWRGEPCRISGSSMEESLSFSYLRILSFGGCGERPATLPRMTPGA